MEVILPDVSKERFTSSSGSRSPVTFLSSLRVSGLTTYAVTLRLFREGFDMGVSLSFSWLPNG